MHTYLERGNTAATAVTRGEIGWYVRAYQIPGRRKQRALHEVRRWARLLIPKPVNEKGVIVMELPYRASERPKRVFTPAEGDTETHAYSKGKIPP